MSGLFFDVLWYIDLIFGMWLYLDDLQFKFEFRSGRMIFGCIMALELVFFVQIWSCPDFFFYVLWYIDLIFGSGRMIFGWVMALELVFFVLYFKLSGLFFTSFEILTWYLVYNYFFLNYFCQSFGPWTCNLKSSHCNVILLIF